MRRSRGPRLQPGCHPRARTEEPKAAGGGKKPPGLVRTETMAIADEMKKEVTGAEYSFLVATLNAWAEPRPAVREKHIGPNDLVDDRARFLETCVDRHWQFDTLPRAQYSTLMLLAILGGAPEQ